MSPEHPQACQGRAGAPASSGSCIPPLTHSRAHFLVFQRSLPTPSTSCNCQEVSERETRYISDLAEAREHSICFVTGQKWKLLPQGRNRKQRQNMIASSGEACTPCPSLLLLASLWDLCTSPDSGSVFHTHHENPHQLSLSAPFLLSELNHKKYNTNLQNDGNKSQGLVSGFKTCA